MARDRCARSAGRSSSSGCQRWHYSRRACSTALTRAAAQAFLTEIWEQDRRTIAFVTHDIDEAVFLGDTVFVMTPRPGRLREVIQIDIPRPRTLDDLGSPRFGELKHQILELIVGHENRDTSPAAAVAP